MKDFDQFEWDPEDSDLFAPLALKGDVRRGEMPEKSDLDKLVNAFDAVGAYDKAIHGNPPHEPERLFNAIENFQNENGLQVDGVVRPNGQTLARLNQLLPTAMKRRKASRGPSASLDRSDADLTWADIWSARRSEGLPQSFGSNDDAVWLSHEAPQFPGRTHSRRMTQGLRSAQPANWTNAGTARTPDLDVSRGNARPMARMAQLDNSQPIPDRPRAFPANSEGAESSSPPPIEGENFARTLRRQIADAARWLERQGYLSPELAESIEYAAVGHHFMPWGVSKFWRLTQEAYEVFRDAVTGPMGDPWHGWSVEHDAYNHAVRELANRWMHERGIDPSRMTGAQANELIRQIHASNDPRIRDFNRRAIAQARRFQAQINATRNAPSSSRPSPGSQAPTPPPSRPASRSAIPETTRPMMPGGGGGGGGGRSTIMNSR